MFNFDEVSFKDIIVHKVGNKHNNGQLQLSQNALQLDEATQTILQHYFLSAFKVDEFFQFSHNEQLALNPVFNYAKQIFESPGKLVEMSKHIAQLLFQITSNPKIKHGEFYVAFFENCVVDDEVCNAIGLFKSENKTPFIKIYQKNSAQLDVSADEGINVNKLDKGCLIFNTEAHDGYKLAIVDNVKQNGEAVFWRDEFLMATKRKDDFYQTQNYMKVCKNFVEEVYNDTNQVEKADQIDFLNRSIDFFKDKVEFNENEFAEQILGKNPDVVEAFQEYKDHYQQKNQVDLKPEFGISNNAVKKGKAQFKSVLKLDKNFHVYIHGDRSLISKDWDPQKGMHYYKIYFTQED